MDPSEVRKQIITEIVQSVLVPVLSALGFLAWLYSLIQSPPPKPLIFPMSGVLLAFMYFFSGPLPAGILLAFVSVVGLWAVFLTSDTVLRLVFFLETAWVWGLFLVLEQYRGSSQRHLNRMREEEEILDTKISIMESEIEANRERCINLTQRIDNYQLLGRMIQVMNSTLREDRIVMLIGELANKFIGRGSWHVKKGVQSDVFARYVRDQKVPLIVRNLARDSRFSVKNHKFLSLVAVPLEVNGRFWGALKGMALQPNVFDENDLRLLSVLGGIASLALNNVKLYERTQELAVTDGLTGLYVQSYFKERLVEEIVRSRSHRLPLSIAVLDVDHFKSFNDTYGHPMGDFILRQIASLLRRRLRETDFLCRYGGEEFAVIMPQTDIREAFTVAEDIRRSVGEERFFLPVESFHPVSVRITVSVGLSTLSGAVGTQDELLSVADRALYRAKESGRDRTEAGQDMPV